MTPKLTTFFAATAIAASLFAGTVVFAADSTTSGTSPTQGTTGDHHGMMGMMGQMSPDHMKQMTAMVDGCNRMMGTQTETPKDQAPDHTK